ncbi:MAG: ATP-binding cassette domain-containing protein [Chitinophagia bacterium]|nr:ATP-binding cassette domain-containing protein [Chitinophagia bacterium]
MIKVENVSFSQKGKYLLSDINFQISSGKFHAIIGPNGAGKSTLIKLLAGSLHPTEGKIWMNGRELSTYSISALAGMRAVLSQYYPILMPIKTEELILLGKSDRFEALNSKYDRIKMLGLLEEMKITHLYNRYYHSLSGGEAQLVQLCRVLLQLEREDISANNKFLFLDEPVSHLDIQYQHAVLAVATSLVSKGITVVSVLHDINLALDYASNIHMMKMGKLIRSTSEEQPLIPEDIRQVYGLDASLVDTGRAHQYMIRIHPPLK